MAPKLTDPAELLIYFVALITATAFGYGFQRFFGEAFSKNPPEDVTFSFNPLVSLDIIGTAVFLLTGFGWGRQMDEKIEFRRRKLAIICLSLVGPFANVAFALTAAYVKEYLWTDQVVELVLQVNVTFLTMHIIPLPPLFASRFLQVLFTPEYEGVWRILKWAGPAVMLGAALVERFAGVPLISGTLEPVRSAVASFIYY
jgi:hypothetical protein